MKIVIVVIFLITFAFIFVKNSNFVCKGCFIDSSAYRSDVAVTNFSGNSHLHNSIDRPHTSHSSGHPTIQEVKFCGSISVTNAVDISVTGNIRVNKTTFIAICLITVFPTVHLMWNLTRNRVKIKSKNKFQIINKFDHLRAILNAISVGVISTDSKFKITYMNSAAGKMCGWCPVLATGRHYSEVVQFDNDKKKLFSNKKLEDHCAQFEDGSLMLLSQDGRYLAVQQVASPLLMRGEIAGAVTLLQDVTSSRELIRNLSYSASHDALTGLPNRCGFENYFRTIVDSCNGSSHHALVFVDLDGFKAINDEAGHAAGDELLKQIAHLMRRQLRRSDFVARLGGDEFCLILFDCDLTKASALMEHLVNVINEYSFTWEGTERHIGASVGITRVKDSRYDIEKLLSEADAACYTAKRCGKGRVCLYEECC